MSQRDAVDGVLDERRGLLGFRAVPGRTQLTLPDELTLDGWRTIGEQIAVVSDSSGWWLGDWLIYGQDRYPDRYRRAMNKTSLDYQTLRNYVWVARRFPPTRRRPGVSFQHHLEVAALPADEQDHWLQLAENFTWSRNELRRQLRSSVDPARSTDTGAHVRLKLNAGSERVTRWNDAATRAGCSFPDWVARILDEAAESVSG